MQFKWNKPILFVWLTVFIIVSGIYSFILIGLPKILSSDKMVAKYEQFISEKVGFQVDIDDFRLKINPNLTIELSLQEISSLKDEIYVNDLFYKTKFLSLMPEIFNADKVYLDMEKFKGVLKVEPKKDSSFDIDDIPIPFINISSLGIKLNDKVDIKAENIKSIKKDSKIETTLLAQVDFAGSDKSIIIGREGKIIYTNKVFVDDLSVEVGNLKLLFDGEGKKIYIKGSMLPANELADTFLYFYKLRHPNKKNFLENFSDFKGYIDVDLSADKDGFYGKCYGKDLGAKFWTAKIPVYIPVTEFIFNKRQMKAKTNGTFGSEPTYTDVVIEGIATKDLHTVGNVKAALTNNFTKKHFPILSINGKADASVKYDVQNFIVNIDYDLDVPINSDISSKYGSLSNTKIVRKIHAHTIKDGDEIKLDKFSYSFWQNDVTRDIFIGDGVFRQINKKYRPVEISFKTNGDVSIGVVNVFLDNFFDKGRFSADLRYNFMKKTLLGNVSLKDVKRNDFSYMKSIRIDVLNDKISLVSNGTFFKSPIKIVLIARNNFTDGIVINNLDINLDKYYVRKGDIDSVKSDFEYKKSKFSKGQKQKQATDYKIEVKNGKIRVGEIINPRFYLRNVVINGSLKDNIVSFTVPETEYAKGYLSAIGKYDIKRHASDILFLASDIDSNEVATKFYNLPNQFYGSSYATLHFLSRNKLNDVRTESTFAITDGFLPNLGDKEIKYNRPKKPKKYMLLVKKHIDTTLSKICNIDFSRPNVFYSNLRGNFKTHNGEVQDIKIYSESNNLSMFIEGNYKIKTQEGKLVVWGRHNKTAERKIKIFKVPLRLIYKVVFKAEKSLDYYREKINQIPPISAEEKDEAIFRVKVEGNLNSNNLKLKFNDIRKGHKAGSDEQ